MPETVAAQAATSRVARSEKGSGTNDNVNRLTLRLPNSLVERLEHIQEVTHASSLNEVIKNALLFYDALVEERANGNDVYVISPEGEKTKYRIFL
jgi:hypothetical protein